MLLWYYTEGLFFFLSLLHIRIFVVTLQKFCFKVLRLWQK